MLISELDLVIDNLLLEKIFQVHKVMFKQVQEGRYVANINHVLFEIQFVSDIPIAKETPSTYPLSGILITAPDTDATYFFSDYMKIGEYFSMNDRGIIQSNLHYDYISDLFSAICIDIMTFILITSTPQGYDGLSLNNELDEEDEEAQEQEEFDRLRIIDQIANLRKREGKLRELVKKEGV